MKPKKFSVAIKHLVKLALREDLGREGDVTSLAIIPPQLRSSARLIAKEKGVLCGLELAIEAFRQKSRGIHLASKCKDGRAIRPGQVILEVYGNTRAILAAERTALNFVQRLSGIATLTHRFVEESRRTSRTPKILDTRKTTPLLRTLEKYAVVTGGGSNHRFGLYDMVLIKDNHLEALAHHFRNPVREAVQRARKRWPKLKIELECATLDQVREAVKARADMILLDNMKTQQLSRAVKIIAGRAKTEASGGICLNTIRAIARTGVDFISAGALTHSAPSIDFSLEIDVS